MCCRSMETMLRGVDVCTEVPLLNVHTRGAVVRGRVVRDVLILGAGLLMLAVKVCVSSG